MGNLVSSAQWHKDHSNAMSKPLKKLFEEAYMSKHDLTLEQHNLLVDQIEQIGKIKVELVKKRDEVETEINKVNKLINALRVITDNDEPLKADHQ